MNNQKLLSYNNLKKEDFKINKNMNTEQIKEFENFCKPLNEWLQKNGNPHQQIVITFEGAELLEGIVGVPFKIND